MNEEVVKTVPEVNMPGIPADNLQPIKKENSFLKILVYTFFAILLLGLGALGFWFFQTKIASPVSEPPKAEVSPTQSIVLPTPTETVIPTSIPTAEPTKIPDLDLLKQAFATKYNHPVSEVTVTVSKNTGSFAQGGVDFAGENGGGWFLAAKKDGQWIIAADGNGTIMCEEINPYDFPTNMVPECYSKDGDLVTR